MPTTPAKTGQIDIQSASLPTALALPLSIGTSACPAGPLEDYDTLITQLVKEAWPLVAHRVGSHFHGRPSLSGHCGHAWTEPPADRDANDPERIYNHTQ
jgi:hypothetical protein